MSQKVNITLVWKWHCPDCNAVNYAEGDSDLSDEDFESAARRDLELEEWQSVPEHVTKGDFMYEPTTLQCSACSLSFSLEESDEEYPEDYA